MTWNLISLDGSVAINFEADGNGGVSGTMSSGGKTYQGTGTWIAGWASSKDRPSLFSFAGTSAGSDALSVNKIAAAGTMFGPGDSPAKIDVAGAVSMHDGIQSFAQTLLPSGVSDRSWVQRAYGDSGCIIVLDASSEGALTCINCYIGGSWIGVPDGTVSGTDPATITIPTTAPANRPVSILFAAPVDHFANPPLSEPHYQMYKILMDTVGEAPPTRAGLLLQYYNGSDGIIPTTTTEIHFNHGRKKTHTSIMIRPSSA